METKITKKDFLNLPNILSYFRIILIPLFVITYMKADAQNEQYYYISTAVLVLSGLTDVLDGIIARKFNLITALGKILDPLADKLTQLTMVICLAIKLKSLPIMIVLMIFIIKEVLMLTCGFIMIRKDITIHGSKWFGKLATVVFYIVMGLIALIRDMPGEILLTLILIAAFFMVFAFFGYISQYKKVIKTDIMHK